MNTTITTKCALLLLCGLYFFPLAIFPQARIPGSWPTNGTNASLYVEPQTPVTASLGRYGDCPVSYFTGRPDISIPLYSFSVRNVTMPITLDYDAGGVMVNSLPGWAGQNWTLNAGGVIMRTPRGKYDDYTHPACSQFINNPEIKNYFQCHDALIEKWKNSNDNYEALKQNVTLNYKDLAPDIFTFHFLDKSGKFFLDTDGKWRVVSDDNLEVIFDYTDESNFIAPLFSKMPDRTTAQPKTIAGFKIRDEEGNTYHFGYDRNAIEYTTNFWQMTVIEDNESWHAMSWYLTKITDRFGNELFRLDYERGAYIMQIFFSYYYTAMSGNDVILFSMTNGMSAYDNGFPYTITISSPVYLSEIRGAGVTVNIGSSYVADELATDSLYDSFCSRYQHNKNSIYEDLTWKTNKHSSLHNNLSYIQEKCYFYYLTAIEDSLPSFRYTPAGETGISTDLLGHTRIKKIDYVSVNSDRATYYMFSHSYKARRLCLDSISLQTDSICTSTNVSGRYRFTYNGFEELPKDYLTLKVDHWGYYNGLQYMNPLNCNWPTLNQGFREPNFYYCKYGSLSEIQYPTGGSTIFEYELNTYGKCQSPDRQSCLEISGKGGGLRVKTIKEYDSPEHTHLLRKRDFYYTVPGTNASSGELFATPIYYWGGPIPVNTGYLKMAVIMSSSVVHLANSFGPSLGYTYVTERVSDTSQADSQVKRMVYRYSNLSDPGMSEQRFEPLYSNYPCVTPYDEFSETGFKRGRLLSETVYDENNCIISSTDYEYRSDNYLDNHFTYTSNLTYEGYIDPNNGHFNGGVYKLYYPKYDIVKKTESVRNSDGSYITTVTVYNKQDYDIDNGVAEVRKCHAVTINRISGSSVLESSGEIYTYPMTDASFINDFYFPVSQTQKLWNGNAIRTDATSFSLRNFKNGLHKVPSRDAYALGASLPYMGNGVSGYTHITYDLYDTDGNLMQYTLNGMAPTSLTWDAYGRLTSKTTGGLATRYYYKKGGLLVGVSEPNGHITRYGYDSFGRLAYTRDTLGVTERYRYNYKMYPFNDGYADDTPEMTDYTYMPEVAYTVVGVVGATCSISVNAAQAQVAVQKQFEIKWEQDVTISVSITTLRESTSILAGINRYSSDGTPISDIFFSSGCNNPVSQTYTVHLKKGRYQLAVQMPHYDNDTSTSASISAAYQTYQ